MTPKERQDIGTIKAMLAELIGHFIEKEKTAEEIIQEFEPPLETCPKMCLEEQGQRTERILKAIQKELNKKDIIKMEPEQAKALSKRMISIIEINWESRKKEE